MYDRPRRPATRERTEQDQPWSEWPGQTLAPLLLPELDTTRYYYLTIGTTTTGTTTWLPDYQYHYRHNSRIQYYTVWAKTESDIPTSVRNRLIGTVGRYNVMWQYMPANLETATPDPDPKTTSVFKIWILFMYLQVPVVMFPDTALHVLVHSVLFQIRFFFFKKKSSIPPDTTSRY